MSTTPSPFWPTLWLALALVLAKAAHWALPEPTARRLSEYVTDVGVSAHQDVLFAVGFGLVWWLALRTSRGSPRAERYVWRTFLALAAFSVLYAVASVQIFVFLRSPLTYPLLYVAGDMKNMRSSIGNFVSPAVAVGLVAAPALFLGLCRLSARRTPPPASPRRAAMRTVGALALVAYLVSAHLAAEGRWKDRDDHLIVRNPHWEFLASSARELAGGQAIRIDAPYPPEYLADFEPPPPRAPRPSSARRPKNVLLYVLESTGARYLSLYGSPYDTTPSLVREAARGVVFDAFYAHIGMTANSLAAITLSIYPYMTWREYTVEYPALPGESLAQVAGRQGLRTAFIHTGDLDYVGQRPFLTNRGFDTLLDIDDLGPRISSWGGDDRDLVDGVLRWVDQDRGRPFYVLAWTQMSHHPYEPRPGQPLVDFFKGALPEDDYDLGRYLNTVQQVDHEIGRLFDGLRERGLAEDTLVLVTGDHGECFGDPHPTWGHGFRLYQEGIRIPLMIVNPGTAARPVAGRSSTVGGHVDINPTITDLMGWPASPTWQGHSLFDPKRPPRTYFYAANEDYLLGVREGEWKYIYNATRGREELYDLARDPDEQENRAAREPERCRELRQRLAAWKDHTGRHLARLRNLPPNGPGARLPGPQ